MQAESPGSKKGPQKKEQIQDRVRVMWSQGKDKTKV